jgi:hypothetical protein
MSATKETLELLKVAQANGDEALAKYFTQTATATSGFQAYNLEAPSKKMVPVLTPLRNMIPRISGGFGVQANWRSVTNINSGNVRAGVAEGKRGGAINHTLVPYLAAFKSIGLENYTTFEAENAARNYEDIRALAVSSTLNSTMIQEERLLLGGNTSIALGTTPTPSLAVASGGALTDASTYRVICVALGLQAYLDAIVPNNVGSGQVFSAATALVPGQITRTNIDGTTDTFGGGSAQQSAVATQATSSPNLKISATVAAVSGAVGYAWFIGVGAGNEKLNQITTINSAVFTANSDAGAQLASTLAASDNSTSSLDYDGLLYQAVKSGSGAYVTSLATGTAGTGSTLTSNGAGGILEFDIAFQYFYDVYRLSPTIIYVSSQESKNISKKVIANAGAPLLRQVEAGGNANLSSGWKVSSILNSITGDDVQIRTHPNIPAGTVMFFTESLPYSLNEVGNIVQVLLRQDYYQIDWPITSRKHQHGVYCDGVLQHYAPFSMGVISNIANG